MPVLGFHTVQGNTTGHQKYKKKALIGRRPRRERYALPRPPIKALIMTVLDVMEKVNRASTPHHASKKWWVVVDFIVVRFRFRDHQGRNS